MSQSSAAVAAANPVVETASGKLRGAAVAHGILAFKGVPYGASTAGANRFLAPKRPEPWTGVRDALAIAGRSPQAAPPPQRPELATIWGPIDTLPVGEDCLTLHLWTPGLGTARRPVMVWLHGGAFSFGSANTPRVDGANLARRGDVVVVTVNHRLNIFGHLHLAELGDERFLHSGNAGVLDLVAALIWVREHIERFGGDPGNVTIFGQSGGGGKVSALCAMPAAKGLFHRAIVQSGSSLRFNEPGRASMLAAAVLQELGLGRDQLDQLQQVPLERLAATIAPAAKTLPRARLPLIERYDFGPVVDGRDLPRQPFDPDAPAQSDDVPMLIGGTKDEMANFLAGNDKVWHRSLSESEARAELAKVAGGEVDRLWPLYPGANPAERLISALTDSNFWIRAALQAERKAARAAAPVWMYDFTWETPVLGGRLKAPHSVDVPFVFDNLDQIGAAAGSPPPQELAARVADTWIAFARSGRPDNPALPAWPAYAAADRATMQLGIPCRLVRDPRPEARAIWSRIATAGPAG
jgi:para-nitrobenzyl esterase